MSVYTFVGNYAFSFSLKQIEGVLFAAKFYARRTLCEYFSEYWLNVGCSFRCAKDKKK